MAVTIKGSELDESGQLDSVETKIVEDAVNKLGDKLGITDGDGKIQVITDLNDGIGGDADEVEIVVVGGTSFDGKVVTKLGDGIDGLVISDSVNSKVSGNEGDNLIGGGAGNDLAIGGGGNDTLLGGQGSDLLFEGDSLSGGSGDDMIFGIGSSSIDGGAGNDYAFGGNSADTVSGGEGSDYVSGGAGNDSVSGGVGDDTVVAASGSDTLSGGEGADVFVFGVGDAGDANQITDFEVGVDRISLGDTNSLQAVLSSAVVQDGNTIITLSDGSTITVVGQTEISADWFNLG